MAPNYLLMPEQRRRCALTLLALLSLAGCVSKQALSDIDDAQCQSYGAKPGEPAYIQCRAQLYSARPPGSRGGL